MKGRVEAFEIYADSKQVMSSSIFVEQKTNAGISVLAVVLLLGLIAGLAAFAIPKVCQHNQAVVVESLVQRYALAHMGVKNNGKLAFDLNDPERMAQEITAEIGGDGCGYGQPCSNHCPIGGVYAVKLERTSTGDMSFSITCSRHGLGASDFLSTKELTALLTYLSEYWSSESGQKAARENGLPLDDTDRANSALLYARLAELSEGKLSEMAQTPKAISIGIPKDFASFMNLFSGLFDGEKAHFTAQEISQMLDRLEKAEDRKNVTPREISTDNQPNPDGSAASKFFNGVIEGLISTKPSQDISINTGTPASQKDEIVWKDDASKSLYP